MLQAQAFVYQLALPKRGDSGAQLASRREVTGSWVNRPVVPPALPEFMKYPNPL